MSEISREECVSRLDAMRNSMSVCLATDNGFENNFKIMKSMCDKAISDMQKLEKIEKIVNCYCKDKQCKDYQRYDHCICCEKMRAIEQIVKEVE